MKKRDILVIIALFAAFAIALAVGLISDRNNAATEAGVPAENAQLVITEVCAKNTAVIKDSDGRYSDYIEVYNQGEDCNLHGFTLTDGKNTSAPFGDTPLAKGEYRVFFIDRSLTGFSISANGGENIFLNDRDGSNAAKVTVSPMAEDQVMEWNGGSYTVTNRATPGFPNTDEGRELFVNGVPDENPSIVISELFVTNDYTLADSKGVFSDIIELHNISDTTVSLGGYKLSDTADNRFRYVLPNVSLGAGEYAIVYCDTTGVYENDEIHASFALSVGETVYLTAPNGKYVSVPVAACADNRSLSLVDGLYVESQVSLGFDNDDNGIALFTQSRVNANASLIISEVLLSSDGAPYQGAFVDAVEIYNRSQAEVNTQGWYLSDGEDPYRYPLPAQTLAPGACVVVVCDGGTDPWHSPFRLSEGEVLVLTGTDHKQGESVAVASAGNGKSLTAKEETDGIGYYSDNISMGYPNTDEGVKGYLAATAPNGLIISELVASNTSSLRGPYGACCDWVELYNASSAAINLKGWYLSDDADELYMGAFPDYTLKSGERYIVFLSTVTENLRSGYHVLPFGISSAGDRLYLSREGVVEDWVATPDLGTDVSYGRPDNSMDFAVLEAVTPHEGNGSAAKEVSAITAKTPQGVYDNTQSLTVELTGDGTIYYTTDCTKPTTLSTVYTGPIRITKTTVIRAIAVAKGKQPSACLDLTYIVNENHSLPVASLVTTPSNLWDSKTGIYAMGNNASPNPPYVGANFWYGWEREASVSLFEQDGGGFTSPCGIRIFGGFSRQQPMKSFSCFFRGKYGASQLNYPLFGDEGLDVYEAFIFRNTGQDYNYARMRDPLLTELASSAMYMPSQKNRPVILYLNGEFWGIYFLREKINENYIAGNFNVTEEEVVLDRLEGSTAEYKEFLSYIKTHNLADKQVYEYVKTQMDVEQYADYIAAQIYICNLDNVNVKFFKTEGGKWTWLLFDVDYSTRSPSHDTVSDHLNPAGTGRNDYLSTTLITAMLKNSEFRDLLIRRLAWQTENVWNYQRVNAKIDEFYNALKPDKQRDCQKWDISYTGWENSVNQIRSFFKQREQYLVPHIQAWFGLTDAQMAEYGFNV